MKCLIYFCSFLFFTGCFSFGVRGEYNSSKSQFYKMVSKPFTGYDVLKTENRFINLKNDILTDEDMSTADKQELLKQVDYYIMLLNDLKD